MPIKQTTPRQAIADYIAQAVSNVEAAAVRGVAFACEKSVNAARSRGSYKDQTGNLRSSIGYNINADGRDVTPGSGGFRQVKAGAEGLKEGRSLAAEVARKAGGQGIIAAALVAGKDYAAHVQNRGYDVLHSGEMTLKSEVVKQLNAIGLK